jgi:multidrug efflux pump subunit AcrA (membrane-fusion protein)
MTASVYAPDVEGSTAIRVPLGAVYNKDGQPLVWVVDPKTSRVQTRAVKLGSAQNDSVLVQSGLSGGETIVTAGVNMLHAGQQVKVTNAQSVALGGRP